MVVTIVLIRIHLQEAAVVVGVAVAEAVVLLAERLETLTQVRAEEGEVIVVALIAGLVEPLVAAAVGVLIAEATLLSGAFGVEFSGLGMD